jgi:hypothetical protein
MKVAWLKVEDQPCKRHKEDIFSLLVYDRGQFKHRNILGQPVFQITGKVQETSSRHAK